MPVWSESLLTTSSFYAQRDDATQTDDCFLTCACARACACERARVCVYVRAYMHACVHVWHQGNKTWYEGRVVAAAPDGTYSISYDDGDFESGVRRENVRHLALDGGSSGRVEMMCAGNRKRKRAAALALSASGSA